jgi:hypothetical protein
MRRLILISLIFCLSLASCGGTSPDASQDEVGEADRSSDLHYSCGRGDPFTAEDVAAEQQPAKEVLDALAGVRQTMDGAFLPEDGWIEVGNAGGIVTLLAPLNDAYASAAFEQRAGGWDPRGWGDCIPRLQVSNRSVLRWVFTNASYPPDPVDTGLEVLVSEVECSSARDIEGLIEAAITYDQEEISIVLTAPGLKGGQDCPGTKPTPYTVILEEPPDERKIVDPSVLPSVEPTPGTRLP